MVAQVGEPSSFQEATQHQVWVDAMVEEYSSIMTNDVWELVPRPQEISIVGSRWIYKIKYAAELWTLLMGTLEFNFCQTASEKCHLTFICSE